MAFGLASGVAFEPLYGPATLDLRLSAEPELHAWALRAGGLLALRRPERLRGREPVGFA